MKKVLAICLMMVMVVSMSVNVFAAPGGFVSSPSGNPAPLLISFDPSDEQCTAKLAIIPYGDRHDLSDALRAMFEKAYNDIADCDDLSKLNDKLAQLVAEKNIDGANLVISDLFDIHVTGCDYHDEHMDFDITLDADTLSHFVGLLHMNKNGEWELVSDAKVVNNGEHLEFSVDAFSPFAIVVEMDGDVPGDASQNENSSMIYYICAIIVAAVALVVALIMKSKKKA